MTQLTLQAPGHPLRAYLGVPAGEGPWPGMVVVHDIFGQTADNRHQADWLTGAGYLVMAPDLYSHGTKPFCVRAVLRDMLTGKGPAFDDVEAARAALAARPDCTGKIGVIGFCMGGGFALLLAVGRGFAASSVNYGRVPKDAAAILSGACPVIGSFGARDTSLKGAAARLEQALTADGVDHDVKEYPEASHAFLNAHGGALGWVMTRVGMGYHAASAADAKARIEAFFARHLH